MASPAKGEARDIGSALSAVEKYALIASEKGASAVCFPEAFLTGYVPAQAERLSLERTSGELAGLGEISSSHRIDILCGFMERSDAGQCVTQGIFRPDGSRDFYVKSHLGESERDVFAPGGSLGVFPLSCGLTAGFQICVELHVPEMTQSLSRRGADIIFCPHSVPGSARKRKGLWEMLLCARGYDARVYIACCNDRTTRHEGGIAAADPEGKLVASGFGEDDTLMTFTVDRALLGRFRTGSKGMSDRYYPLMARGELY